MMHWIARYGAVFVITGGLLLVPKSFALQTTSPQQSSAQKGTDPKPPSAEVPERDADGNYKVGKGVIPPQVIHFVDPEFTEAALRAKLGGVWVVSAVVDENGVPGDVHVVRSPPPGKSKKSRAAARSLDESTVKAVQQFRFAPGTYLGKPVPVVLDIEIAFPTF